MLLGKVIFGPFCLLNSHIKACCQKNLEKCTVAILYFFCFGIYYKMYLYVCFSSQLMLNIVFKANCFIMRNSLLLIKQQGGVILLR